MNRKQIAIIPLLILVIFAAALLAAVRVRNGLKAPTPRLPSPLDRKADKIDMKSYEVFSETLRDWTTKYAPDAAGYYRNPRTGEYTMVTLMKCASCGQLIPVPELPPGLVPNPELVMQRGPEGQAARTGAMMAVRKFQSDYKCPRCGKYAFPFALMSSPATTK
jgi:hypothetical protein